MSEVKDMLTIIYNKLLSNTTISELTLANDGKHRIRYYQNPETADHDNLFVVITPLGPPKPGDSGSDKQLNLEFTIQINVESIVRMSCKTAAHEIQSEMFALGFSQLSDGIDEFMTETNRFVDARRYRGKTKLYDTNY
ncbi:gp10 protein [Lactobacillus plantarum JDM1] [Lactiplantibacillus mudanjiangensis]|uniref:hypothetical protein n=1 Tax=Lactiplantibacillus mudanjiangensis TaxID=1296538 RepID=UPI0010159D2D|nr:gp10 protein [Lactobacillus plantarum JDM1] [Lactiplantibacillus mudanjiangensis]